MELEENNLEICDMDIDVVPVEIFHSVIKKLKNWKSPGSDCIHNFWYKKINIYSFILI